MHIKILLKIYYYDMHVVSGKGKRLFQHMAHAPLQNNIQDGKSKMSHAVPFPTHRAASQKVLKEWGEEGEETQNWMWILNKGSTAKIKLICVFHNYS